VARHFAGWPEYEILPYQVIPSPAPQMMSTKGLSLLSSDKQTIQASKEIGKVGDVVEVTISLENNPGITDVQLLVSYNKSELKLVGVIDGGKLGQTMHTPNYSLYPYRLTWWNGFSNPADFGSNGVIVKLQFEILVEVDNSPITITPNGITNKNDLPVVFGVVNGSVTSEIATLVENPISKAVLLAYPNPVSIGSELKIEGVAEGSLIEVYNLSGICVYRTVVTDNPASLILNVPAGVYLVRTNIGEVKVVINN
jgi:hypothetical protein